MHERAEFQGVAGSTVCDSRFLPIVVMQWFGKVELEPMERYADWVGRLLAWMEQTSARGVLISDLRAAERPSPALRRRIGEVRHGFEASMRRVMLDDLVIIDNPMARGIISAISWVKPDIRMTVVASMDKALIRARERLHDAGLEAPDIDASAFARAPAA